MSIIKEAYQLARENGKMFVTGIAISGKITRVSYLDGGEEKEFRSTGLPTNELTQKIQALAETFGRLADISDKLKVITVTAIRWKINKDGDEQVRIDGEYLAHGSYSIAVSGPSCYAMSDSQQEAIESGEMDEEDLSPYVMDSTDEERILACLVEAKNYIDGARGESVQPELDFDREPETEDDDADHVQ